MDMKRIEERYISLLTDFGLKAYRDVKNSIDTALEKGREEGKNSKALQIAKKMLDAGMDIETVMQITDLPKNKIDKLK
jgi:predicted transposase/invertase (TIGR01784 family)